MLLAKKKSIVTHVILFRNGLGGFNWLECCVGEFVSVKAWPDLASAICFTWVLCNRF